MAREASNKRQFIAIAFFIGAGAISVYLFFLITGLQIFQGATEHFWLMVMSFAWVLIFPTWILLFMAAMLILNAFWPQ
ncbi:MAG: hypothetical protein GY935_11910 [Gammaproteobacteria bacterium]|nr:hypothetical protein [Gammaproteobacteria bacterium]